MVLGIVAIGIASVASLAIPFFFPTPAEQATVELNNKLNSNQSFLSKDGSAPKTGFAKFFEGKTGGLDNKLVIVVVIAILFILLVVVK